MRFAKFVVVSSIFMAVLTVGAFAQAKPAVKVAAINTGQFLSKDKGIKKLAIEFQKLETEFKPLETQLKGLNDQLVKAQNEYKAMQENKAVPVKPEAIRAKAAEIDKLQRELKFKQDDAQASYNRRQSELMNPVMNDIYTKIQDFAKQKGFDMVLDSANLYRTQSLLYLNASIDITEEFINYYNALPAGTASK